MVKIQIVSKAEAAEWVRSLHSKPSMALGILLAGDRWSCVTEVAVAMINDKIVGIATIAPDGEQMSGKPTIVAIYVLYEHRKAGVGYQLFETAVDYMLSKELEPIRVDVMNSKVLRMINRLPIEKRQKLSVADHSGGGAIDATLEI